MHFDLEDKLQKLIRVDKLEEAIHIVEKELSKYQETDFPKIIGKSLLHQVEELGKYLESFICQLKSRLFLKSVYGEMNGFSVNYELWFVDYFGFEHFGGMDDLDWLAEFKNENVSINSFQIKGFEEIQTIYQMHHENEMYKFDEHKKAADICDYVVILRLQQLHRKAINKGKAENKVWANMPILIAAHDYELVYRVN